MKSTVSTVLVSISLLFTFLVPASAQPSSSTPSESQNALMAGTYTNQKLLRDTANSLVEYGYIKPFDDINMFIIGNITGPVGKRTWRELWLTSPDHNPNHFAITFTEDGNGSAYFSVTPIYDVDQIRQ